MPEQYNTKRALQHLQRAQMIMQYGATQRKALSSKGSLQFGVRSIDKGKGQKETRRGERVFIRTFWKVARGTLVTMKRLRSVIKDQIVANTNFIIQAIDIEWTELPTADIRMNELRVEIFTERVHTQNEIDQLEDELEDQLDEAVIAFDVEYSEDSVDMSFHSEVCIFDRDSPFAKEEGWDWNAMPSMQDEEDKSEEDESDD